jgi:hypothetical protein
LTKWADGPSDVAKSDGDHTKIDEKKKKKKPFVSN